MLAKTVTTVVTKLEGLVRLSIGGIKVLDSELLWSTLVQWVSPKITHQRVARDGADIIVGMSRCQSTVDSFVNSKRGSPALRQGLSDS
jgi:hypothetical protein